jgi:hypothetical protein
MVLKFMKCNAIMEAKHLRCYNTDLIEAVDQVNHKLSQTLTLVDSIQNQSTK